MMWSKAAHWEVGTIDLARALVAAAEMPVVAAKIRVAACWWCALVRVVCWAVAAEAAGAAMAATEARPALVARTAAVVCRRRGRVKRIKRETSIGWLGGPAAGGGCRCPWHPVSVWCRAG